MPAWWGKKSSKHKQQQQQQSPLSGPYNLIKSSLKNDSPKSKTKDKDDSKKESFDDSKPNVMFSRNSPRRSKELTPVGSSGFSGLDSDSVEKIGLPLPTPDSLNDHGVVGFGSGSASGSVSSIGSCGSSDDNHPVGGGFRGNVEINFNTRPRSPGPASRGATSPTSPLHPRLSTVGVDSPTGKLEDGKSQGHKLPLPPGSPTSPSTVSNSRTSGVVEHIPNSSKWKKGRLLGRGTFGHVYLGFNSESGQMCAIKEVRVVSDDQSSKECLKQLNQEINLLSQLSHPNIVQYYGSDLGEESLSVYLEYVSGGSIHKLLQEYGPFKEPVIQNYTRQILAGLAYLHARNTVHRDIKGANILVDPNGEIKLADFGMAKHINSASSMLSFKGSPYWMAPEVVMNTHGYSLAVDIWSLGCTILEMATSKPPWSQYEGVAAIFKIGNSKDIPEIPNHLSNDAKNFLNLCLQRDPSLRPSALQLLEHSFIREQATTRVANVRVTRDAFPYAFDGSRTPPVLELHSRRTSTSAIDGNFAMKPVTTTLRSNRSPRDNARTITSLPVSPSSSPLRQLGPLHKSCLLSPPHPSYTAVAHNGFNFSASPTRQNATYTLDPFQEPFLKSQTPWGSPKSRII